VVHKTPSVKLEQMAGITWQWVKTWWREGSVKLILAIINHIHPNTIVFCDDIIGNLIESRVLFHFFSHLNGFSMRNSAAYNEQSIVLEAIAWAIKLLWCI